MRVSSFTGQRTMVVWVPGDAGQVRSFLGEERSRVPVFSVRTFRQVAVLGRDPVALENFLEAHHLPGEPVEVLRVLDATPMKAVMSLPSFAGSTFAV
jgi:hypothetical protein